MGKNKKRAKNEDMMDEPTPRFRYEGNMHPILGEPVFRIDGVGLRAAQKEIMRLRGQSHSGIGIIEEEIKVLQARIVSENQLPN